MVEGINLSKTNIQQNFCKNAVSTAMPYKTDRMATFQNIISADSFNTSSIPSTKIAEDLKEKGNYYARKKDYKKAIDEYKKALQEDPNYLDVKYNMAKTYKLSGNYKNAIEYFKEITKENPEDLESVTSIGECYKKLGDFSSAKNYFNKVLKENPNYDLAKRELKETKYLEIKKINPDYAEVKKNEQALKNLNSALDMASSYFPQETINGINDITFTFDKTSSLSGHSNIAQYEDDRRRIVITDKYIWASPEIIAAYMVHEIVHGHDNDSFTSIKEEQDAYRDSVKFWMAHNDGINDPEMDYAAHLYKISPEELDRKVAEIYSSRDSSMPNFSPNHGLASTGLKYFFFKTKKHFAAALNKDQNGGNRAIVSETGIKLNDFR